MDFAPLYRRSDVRRINASVSISGSGISTEATLVSFHNSSQTTPVVQAVVEFPISSFDKATIARYSPLEKNYTNSFGVVSAGRPVLVVLTLSQIVEAGTSVTTRTRAFSLHSVSATMIRDTAKGALMRLTLASIDGLMSLQEVLWEGQTSVPPRFSPAQPVDTTWNNNFNTTLSRAADWSFISAATGLTWAEYDAPPASTSLSIPTNEPITYLDMASSVAQLWGRYVTQADSVYSWKAERFAREDLAVVDVTTYQTLVSEEYGTNVTDWADVVDFECVERVRGADGMIEEARRVKRVGSRSNIVSRVARVPIQAAAAKNQALLERARKGIAANTLSARITTLLDITTQLGQRVNTLAGELYVAGIDHDFDAGTTTLDLRYQFPTIEYAPVQTFTIQADGYDWDVSTWTPQPVPPFVTLTYSNLRFNAPATIVVCNRPVRSGSVTMAAGANLVGRDLFLPAGASGSYTFTVTT